ncbi:MAG: protein kinase [Ktedonobacteraceae bacterium]|nr:protein kinase [Ktedonobacteraceae bacterium]
MNELAGQNLGGYQLEEEIGRGSMGMVYRGKQFALGREVAVKVLPRALAKDASYVARFIREAQIVAGLNHPNIVQIYDAGQQNGLLYFVMEYVQGPTLGSLLRLDGMIPHYLAAEYAAQIAEALDCAYREHNVIHRDIKPENLMLDRWGKVKVMDFGLARATGHQQITIAKTLVGSIYYASPEQVWGHTLDNRSDIYALGVVLYEMVCGQRPFTGRSLPELTQAIVNGPLRPPSALNPELSQELEQIILRAMARDINERFTQAQLLARELRALNLKPSPILQITDLPTPPKTATVHPPQGQRERIVIHPPKRPQAQRPISPAPETRQPTGAQPPIRLTGISEGQLSSADQQYPMSYPPASSPAGPPEQRLPDSSNEQPRRTFWQQLHRLLKPPRIV